jgi:hypothetical protein
VISQEWDNIKWRQGSICLASALVDKLPEDDRYHGYEICIAITHDCDIANDDFEKEPFIEFLPAKFLDRENGNYLYGKNPRILNLRVFKNCIPSFVEIVAHARFKIKKENLLSVYPDENYSLDDNDKKILQDWLASRYRRHALPDDLGYYEKLNLDHISHKYDYS